MPSSDRSTVEEKQVNDVVITSFLSQKHPKTLNPSPCIRANRFISFMRPWIFKYKVCHSVFDFLYLNYCLFYLFIKNSLGLFTIYTLKSGNFVWNVNGKTNLVFPNGKFLEKTRFPER